MAATTGLVTDLGFLDQLHTGRLGRRLVQLFAGLGLYGLSMALMIRGALGQAPWDALHIGVTRHLPLSFGVVVIAVSFAVLLLWIPLRERPGVGTIANALTIGTAADLSFRLVGTPTALGERFAYTTGGVLLCGFASALYIGAQLGRGPRDGLMTGLARVTGLSLQLVRTLLEVAVLALGLLLGGSFGYGTVLFALAIGPLTQAMLPWTAVRLGRAPARARARARDHVADFMAVAEFREATARFGSRQPDSN